MTPPLVEPRFATRIGHSLAVAVGIVVAGVLLVGGTSLTLAFRIFLNLDAVAEEYGHILKLGEVHSAFDDLIFELHQMDSIARSEDHPTDARFLHEEIVRKLQAVGEMHRRPVGEAEPKPEGTILGDLRRLSEEGEAVTKRAASGAGRLTELDREWLARATHEVPRRTEELAGLHRSRIATLLERSRQLIQAIVALYVAFMVVGGLLVTVASVAANRGIAAPLRRLSDAAQGIAEGRLASRVRVTSGNEIGVLSRTFNVMADRLQEHERELRQAHDALQEKVRETQALYRIGMEISRLQQLDRVLQSVVDKARELLRADAVALCIHVPPGGDLVGQATSGPPEAFWPGEAPRCEPVSAEAFETGGAVCPLIRPEYARGHLGVPLRLGDDHMGAIHVSTREPREFTTDEAELLAALATQAAIAIERTRRAEEVRSLAAVEERERLAREMHDGLAQALGLLHLKLQMALERTSDATAVEALREMIRITEHAYEDVRQSIFGLRTFVSRGLGLVPTLAEYLHEFSVQNGIDVALEVVEGAVDRLPPGSEVQAVRIIQEALTNVRKHAQADRARVRLQRNGAWVRVAIEDGGVGWDQLAPPDRHHVGLQSMRERAEGLGGRLEIDTAPGRGARVVATLPGGGV